MLLSDALRQAVGMMEREPGEPHRWAVAFPCASRRRAEMGRVLAACVEACERAEAAPRRAEAVRDMTGREDVATVTRVQRALREVGDASLARLEAAWEACGLGLGPELDLDAGGVSSGFKGDGPWTASVPNGNEALVLHVARRPAPVPPGEPDLVLTRERLSPASETAGGAALDLALDELRDVICGVDARGRGREPDAARQYLRAVLDRANAVSSAGARFAGHPTLAPADPGRVGAFGWTLPPSRCAPAQRLTAALEVDVAPPLFEDEPAPLSLVITSAPPVVMTCAGMRELAQSAVATPVHHKHRWTTADLHPLAVRLVGGDKAVAHVETSEGRSTMMFVVPPSPDTEGAVEVGRVELVAEMHHGVELHRIERVAAALRRQTVLNAVLADCLRARPSPPASSRPLDAHVRVDVATRGESEIVFSVQEVASHLVSFSVAVSVAEDGSWALAGTSDAEVTRGLSDRAEPAERGASWRRPDQSLDVAELVHVAALLRVRGGGGGGDGAGELARGVKRSRA